MIPQQRGGLTLKSRHADQRSEIVRAALAGKPMPIPIDRVKRPGRLEQLELAVFDLMVRVKELERRR